MNNTSNILKKAMPLLALIFWLAVWLLIALLLNKPLLLPTPLAVTKALGRLLLSAAFWQALALSLLRIVAGIMAALLLGILLGFACVRLKLLDAALSPLMNLLKATPVASVIFLLLLWVGRAQVPVLIAFMMALPIVWSNVREGLLQTDRLLLEMAAVFGVSGKRVLTGIRLPSLKPYLLAAARSAIALAWKAGIAAEVLCTPERSIGRAIYEGKLYLITDELFAWTFVVILISVLIEWGALKLLDRARGNTTASDTQREVTE